MSSWKSCLRKGGIAVGASALVAGAIAAPAGAAVAPISGGGASLQSEVQRAWLGAWDTLNSQSGSAYAGSSSGTGLRNLGLVNSSPALGSPLFHFVGTDDPPSGTQLTQSGTVTGTNAITLPVAQAPVAVPVSIPAEVTGATGQLRVTNATLEELFRGALPSTGGYPANSWGSFLTAAGQSGLGDGGTGVLNNAVTVAVRSSTSGTTYGFKNYLTKVDSLRGNSNWLAYNNGDVSWPSTVATGFCAGATLNSSGQALVSNVAATDDGAVGYANLADAVARFTRTLTNVSGASLCSTAQRDHLVAYALVQNNGVSGSATYADPQTAAGLANVRTDRVDWTNIRGEDPATAGRSYPGPTGSWFDAGFTANLPAAGVQARVEKYGVVASTYAVVFDDYNTTQLKAATAYDDPGYQTVEDSVCDYAKYLTSLSPYVFNGAGSLLLTTGTNAKYYGPLPTNVLSVAQTAARSCG